LAHESNIKHFIEAFPRVVDATASSGRWHGALPRRALRGLAGRRTLWQPSHARGDSIPASCRPSLTHLKPWPLARYSGTWSTLSITYPAAVVLPNHLPGSYFVETQPDGTLHHQDMNRNSLTRLAIALSPCPDQSVLVLQVVKM
jgi:hypothetical protein